MSSSNDNPKTTAATSTRVRRAVFFDRDGTLNVEVGHMIRLNHFEMYPFASRAVKQVNDAGLLAIVITNQSGVARGFFPEQHVHTANAQLVRHIEDAGARIDRIYYCPHHPEGPVEKFMMTCHCRKPAPGMLEQAAAEFGIQLNQSFVVGDRFVDIEAAHRVGASSVLVLTGAGGEELAAYPNVRQPHHVAGNAEEAVAWILAHL
ncbi:MAG: HAD family hydrolase [Acidobacteria bacterium]|nr:HAD family hydrolase [Acidobacteriota bacterium]